MHVTTETILKHRIEFHVSQHDGTWDARTQGEDSTTITQGHDTLAQAKRATRMELKKKQIRVAVPFTHLTTPRHHDSSPPKLYRAIARGRHALRRHEILVWIDDGTEKGKTDTIRSYYSTVALNPNIPQADLDKLQKYFTYRAKAQTQLDKVNKLIDTWIDEHSFNLSATVDEAIKAQEEESQPSSPPTNNQP